MRLDGAQFGGLRVIRELGKGGMGVVFEAESMIERLVALKVLHGPEHDEATRKRFFHEGRLTSKLNHPNTVFMFGTQAIRMELVPGGNSDELACMQTPVAVGYAIGALL